MLMHGLKSLLENRKETADPSVSFSVLTDNPQFLAI
jgi:hypothetical protein